MGDYSTDRDVRARKAHKCDWCKEPIEVGELHRVESGHFESSAYRFRFHLECEHALANSPCRAWRSNGDYCEGCDDCDLWCEQPRGGYGVREAEGTDDVILVYGPSDLVKTLRDHWQQVYP